MTSGSRILIVDDDEALRMIISEELTGEFSRQNHIVASGAFSDGVQQVLLDTFV